MGRDGHCWALMPLLALVRVFILKSAWVPFSIRGPATSGRGNKTALFHVQFCSVTSRPLLRDCPPQRKQSETACRIKITQASNEKQNILNKRKAKEDKKPP